MANNLNVVPIYIDTAFASFKAVVAATLGTLFTLRVYSVRWVGPAASGDQVVIEDPQGGEQLLLMRNTTANGPDLVADWSAAPRLWRDFGVAQISSGKLFIDARM